MDTKKETKKWYKKWWVWLIAIVVGSFLISTVKNFVSNIGLKELPNVMGLSYTDATNVLKDNGFKVTAVEADAEGILSESAWNRSVKQGIVFSVNGETYPNYSEKTKNKQVTIIYAADDYIYEETELSSEPESQSESNATQQTEPEQLAEEQVPVSEKEEPSENTSNANDADNISSDGMRPEFKEAMDSYEKFYDEYCAFMKQYKNNPTDLSLLAKYAEMAATLTEMSYKFEKWENNDLNDAELKYYLDVNNRITKKLLDV